MRITSRPGTLLIDMLIGLAVFSLIVMGVVVAMIGSLRGMLASGDRVHAIFLNQEAVEVARSIRDTSFAGLTTGKHGYKIGSDGLWQFTGTGVVTTDGFTTSLTVDSLGAEDNRLTAVTTWKLGQNRSGSSTLLTELTDWRVAHPVGNWASVTLQGSYIDGGTPLFNAAATSTDYAFVTSDTSAGGKGLYVFDISNLASPQRAASSFDLGDPGYGVLLAGNFLYVVTGDANAEIKIYDASSPATLSSGNLTASINVPGNAKARAIALTAGTLFVAAQENTDDSEIFAYDTGDLSNITLKDSLDDPGSSMNGVALRSGYAYLPSSNDVSEIRVADVADPTQLALAPGEGYNMADTPDGTSAAVQGKYLLVGRNAGTVTEELGLFDVGSNPVPTSAPWTDEVGANVNAVDADPTATYGFAATDNDTKELIVLNLANFAAGGQPEAASYNTSTGKGRGVHYSSPHDRVFLLTNKAFLILKPA